MKLFISLLSLTCSFVFLTSEAIAASPQNVLCIYNSNSSISKQICDYYLQKRDGAKKLGLEIPDSHFTVPNLVSDTLNLREEMGFTRFDENITRPVMRYVNADPSITHIAVAKDIPIRIGNSG